MTEFIKNIQDALISRVNNMLFINFIIAWLFINYDITLTVLFKKMSIDEKISYIDKLAFNFDKWLFFPLIIALLYIYAMPYINLGISKLYSVFVNESIKDHENYKLEKEYERKKAREIIRLESTVFVERDLETKKKQIESEAREKEIQLKENENIVKQETIELEERENLANKEKIELSERENLAKRESIDLIKKEEKIKKEAIKKVNDLYEEKEEALEQMEKNYDEKEEAIKQAESVYIKRQEDIKQAESVYIKRQEDIKQAEGIYASHQKAIKQAERVYIKQQEAIKQINKLNDEEKDIIKIIAINSGTINIHKLYENMQNMQNDNVKIDYYLDEMLKEGYVKKTKTLHGNINITLLTKGKKLAIDEGYVK